MNQKTNYIQKIDNVFGFLLMSRNLLETTIPDSDSESAINLACALVSDLIILAIEELYTDRNSFYSSSVSCLQRFGNDNFRTHECSACEPPLIDVDAQIGARLRELFTTAFPKTP
jgi:hypothetical protein